MTKDEAIRWYREIQSGAGVDREAPLAVVRRGSIARQYWDDPTFSLGVEYGVLIALARAFEMTAADVGAGEESKP